MSQELKRLSIFATKKGPFNGGMNIIAYMVNTVYIGTRDVNVNCYTAKIKKTFSEERKRSGKVKNDGSTILSAMSNQVVLPSPSQERHHRARGSRYNGRRVQPCTELESW